MKKIPKAYADFSKGLVDSVAPDNMADDELAQADNIDLSDRGGFKKRKGTVNINAESYGDEVNQVLEWARNDGTVKLLAMIGNDLCEIAEDGSKTVIKAGLNSTQIGYCFFVSNGEKMFFVDGTNYYQWDGSAAPTAVSPASGADLTPIKRCKYLIFHPKSFRIFAAGDSQDPAALYYSERGDPTNFKGTSKRHPISGDGPITGLSVFMSAMLAFYRRSVYAWKGVSFEDMEWGEIPIPDGTVAARSIINTPVSQTFLGQEGLTAIQPGVLDENIVMVANSNYVLNISEKRIDGLIASIKHPETACGVYHEGRYFLAYGDDSGSPKNNKILVLDWKMGAFSRYTGLQVNSFCQRQNGDLIFGTYGHIRKMGVGFDDAGQPYEMAVKTKAFGLDAPFNDKKVKKLLVAARQYGIETSSAAVHLKVDRLQEEYVLDLDETLIWGDIWGDNVWGWDDLITKEARVNLKGKRFQLTFTNANIEPCTIYGIGFIGKLKKAKGVKAGVTASRDI